MTPAQTSFLHCTANLTTFRVQPPVRARATDPQTSQDAAAMLNCDAQLARLMAVYRAYPDGLTDREAGILAHLDKDQDHKRCSDLRDAGLIVVVRDANDEPIKRRNPGGREANVCRACGAG